MSTTEAALTQYVAALEKVATQTATTIRDTQRQFHHLMWEAGGPGLTLFSLGFVTLIGSVLLGLALPGSFTVDEVFAVMAVGASSIALSCVFFLASIRAGAGLGEAAVAQNERIIELLTVIATTNAGIASNAGETRGGITKPPPETD